MKGLWSSEGGNGDEGDGIIVTCFGRGSGRERWEGVRMGGESAKRGGVRTDSADRIGQYRRDGEWKKR